MMAYWKQIVFLVISAIIISSLSNLSDAQTTTDEPNPCEIAGGECSLLYCLPGEDIDAECPNGRMSCCRKSDPEDSPVTGAPPADDTKCAESGGRCLQKCVPGDNVVPDMECPRPTMCCMSEGGRTTTTENP